jgi:1,4-alpha-glucan branching enzyme
VVPYDDNGRDMGAVQSALQGSYAGDPFARLLFTEDHDTVGNGGSRLPSAIDPANWVSFAARRRSMLAAALLLTAPGVPMLFMGQESLAGGTFANPPAPLAGSIPPEGAKVRAYYKDLIALRRNLGGMSGGLMGKGVDILHRNDTNKVIAYRRYGSSGEDVIVVLNFRNKAYTEYDIGVPGAGTWRIRVDADWKTYGDDFGGGQTGSVQTIAKTKDGQPNTLPVKLGAYAAVVFSR